MKRENNWRYKNLESLEKRTWDHLKEKDGYLLSTCYALTKKPVDEFDVEDLRIMIGQDIGLKYLIPLALEVLKDDILAEGHFYEGDLLKSVLTSNNEYWKEDVENWKSICNLFEKNSSELQDFDTTASIKNDWFESYSKFKLINTEQ